MSELEEFRRTKDEYFKKDPGSPLESPQRREFTGLKYYPENPDLCFEVVLEKVDQPERIILATSTGDQQDYIHFGQVRFQVNGQDTLLQVYISEAGGDYFIPFVDATAPKETYGAGRYLEPQDLGSGRLRLDFNRAYNPYCAYNDLWSCPLPPRDNRLTVRIEAGEKKFHE